MCDERRYADVFSQCIVTSDKGCGSSAYEPLSTSLFSTCELYKSTANIECQQCYTSAINSLDCFDHLDYGCLCGPRSDEHLSIYKACATENGCPEKSIRIRESIVSRECLNVTPEERAGDGCLPCQIAVASDLDCSGNEDLDCLCPKRDEYFSSLGPCAEKSCFANDLTTARNSFTSRCNLFSLGVTPIAKGTGDAAEATGKSSEESGSTQEGDGDGDDDDDEGPETVTVVGVVAGAVAGLSVLLIGGYFIFKKRSTREKIKNEKKKKPPLLPVRPNLQAHAPLGVAEISSSGYFTGGQQDHQKQESQVGVYEMWGSQQYSNHPPALPSRPGPPMNHSSLSSYNNASAQFNRAYELENQQTVHSPYANVFELDSRRSRQVHGSTGHGWHRGSVSRQGYSEPGPV